MHWQLTPHVLGGTEPIPTFGRLELEAGAEMVWEKNTVGLAGAGAGGWSGVRGNYCSTGGNKTSRTQWLHFYCCLQICLARERGNPFLPYLSPHNAKYLLLCLFCWRLILWCTVQMEMQKWVCLSLLVSVSVLIFVLCLSSLSVIAPFWSEIIEFLQSKIWCA